MNTSKGLVRPRGAREIDLRRLAEFHAVGSELQNSPAETQRLIRLVLNEAEALAMQTGIAELVLPSLAEEKVGALRQWAARQQKILNQRREWSLAA
jgi:hypothetical protein